MSRRRKMHARRPVVGMTLPLCNLDGGPLGGGIGLDCSTRVGDVTCKRCLAMLSPKVRAELEAWRQPELPFASCSSCEPAAHAECAACVK